ncbi:MAG: hypothetical protein ACKPKO_05085 [Candidatus Fonsibacter sp.]
MYKSFILHDHDMKFHIPNMQEDNNKKEDNQEQNSKDHETIRKLLNGTDQPKKKIQ